MLLFIWLKVALLMAGSNVQFNLSIRNILEVIIANCDVAGE